MLTLDWATRAGYVARLFSSHDFAYEVDVLDLDERPVGTATMLDGEIQIIPPDNGIRRTASITLSDPEGALNFAQAASWSDSTLWVNRLLRITHVIEAEGREVRATCFVGVPTSLAREGAEVDVTLADKAALANRGARPMTVAKGANAVAAIRLILSSRTGEFRFRFPASSRRLSRNYVVGLADEASPFAVASAIAVRELGMQLLYAADGACLLRPIPRTSSLVVPGVTSPPSSSVDLSGLVNWVQVTGKATERRVSQTQTIKTMPQAIAEVATGSESPVALQRKGVARLLPLVIEDTALTTTAQVKARADRELAAGNRAPTSEDFNTIPFFHADADDIVTLATDGPDVVVRLSQATIPLGVASDMTIGRNVSARSAPRVRSQVRLYKWRQTTRKVKRGRRTKTVTSGWKRV